MFPDVYMKNCIDTFELAKGDSLDVYMKNCIDTFGKCEPTDTTEATPAVNEARCYQIGSNRTPLFGGNTC